MALLGVRPYNVPEKVGKPLKVLLIATHLILHYRQVVSNLLQSPQWETLLQQQWERTTPFCELIKKMPGIMNFLRIGEIRYLKKPRYLKHVWFCSQSPHCATNL